jgi:hypothetical protein
MGERQHRSVRRKESRARERTGRTQTLSIEIKMRTARNIVLLMAATILGGCQTAPLNHNQETGPWGPEEGGLRTRLCEITNSYARGYLKLLSLSMENVSARTIQYDDQQVACNGSLIVKRNGVELVPFRGEVVSTAGQPKTIEPRWIVPLFNSLILEEQYDISQPGLYTVQFRGFRFDKNSPLIPPSNVITIRMKQ